MDVETAFESERSFTPPEFAGWAERHASGLARYELLNGRIVMNPASGWPQGETSATVAAVLYAFVRGRGLGRVFAADQGFELPSGDTVGPDAAYVSQERWTATAPHEPGRFLRLVPELVVEVLAPATGSRDRGEKKAIYERNGTTEYWLLDVRSRRLTQYVLAGGGFGAPRGLAEDETVESSAKPGLRVRVGDLIPT